MASRSWHACRTLSARLLWIASLHALPMTRCSVLLLHILLVHLGHIFHDISSSLSCFAALSVVILLPQQQAKAMSQGGSIDRHQRLTCTTANYLSPQHWSPALTNLTMLQNLLVSVLLPCRRTLTSPLQPARSQTEAQSKEPDATDWDDEWWPALWVVIGTDVPMHS